MTRTVFTPAKPIPTICWSSGCANVAAEQQDPRWRGRYCQPCQTALAADAERIAAQFAREAVTA